MAKVTRTDVRAVVGPIDDVRVSQILATGAGKVDLLEAHAWVSSDDALMDQGRPTPKGVVAQLVDILTAEMPEPDEP